MSEPGFNPISIEDLMKQPKRIVVEVDEKTGIKATITGFWTIPEIHVKVKHALRVATGLYRRQLYLGQHLKKELEKASSVPETKEGVKK
jgi:hypothetical protein